MQPEQKDCRYEFSVEETEEGYAIHLKGDKEKVKAKLDALDSFFHHGDHKSNHGFLTLVHKHIQAIHRHKQTHLKHQEAE